MKKIPKMQMENVETFYDMDLYDKRAMDLIRLKVHEYFFISANDTSFFFHCFEAVKQFFVVFKYACAPKPRKKFDDKLTAFQDKIKGKIGNQIPKKTYFTYRQELSELIDEAYKLKQMAGLGMKVERKKDAEAYLKEVIS